MKSVKTEIKWAFIFTAVMLLWMVLERVSGLHDEYIDYHMYLTNLFAIPAIAMMVLALREKKRVDYGGRITYLQGLASGAILSLLIALLSPLAQWITSHVITPEFFPNVIAYAVRSGYYATEEEARAFFNFENYAVQGAIGALAMGVVTTAVAMVFLRTKDAPHVVAA